MTSTWDLPDVRPAVTTVQLEKSRIPDFFNASAAPHMSEMAILGDGKRLLALTRQGYLPHNWEGPDSEAHFVVGRPQVWDLMSGRLLVTFNVLTEQLSVGGDGAVLAIKTGPAAFIWSAANTLDSAIARYVEDTYERHVSEEAVHAVISKNTNLPEADRNAALDLAAARGERDPRTLAARSIALSVRQGQFSEVFAEALLRARTGFKMTPLDPVVLVALGIAEYRSGLYGDSERHLATAFGKGFHDEQLPALFHAMDQFRLGKRKEAREQLHAAIEMFRDAEIYEGDHSPVLTEAKRLIR